MKKLNGLVRQYLPNGSSFADLTQERLNAIGMALKERARKGVNHQFFAPVKHKHKLTAKEILSLSGCNLHPSELGQKDLFPPSIEAIFDPFFLNDGLLHFESLKEECKSTSRCFLRGFTERFAGGKNEP